MGSYARIQGWDTVTARFVNLKVDSSGIVQTSASGGAGAGGSVTQGTNPWVVSAASLPLPSGAATGARQDTGNTSLASIDTKLTNPLPVSGTFWQTTQPVSGTFWQTTQPVSGTFWQTTQPVSAA